MERRIFRQIAIEQCTRTRRLMPVDGLPGRADGSRGKNLFFVTRADRLSTEGAPNRQCHAERFKQIAAAKYSHVLPGGFLQHHPAWCSPVE